MVRRVSRQLRNPRQSAAEIKNNVGGLRSAGTKYGLPRNSYTDCVNVIVSHAGKFRRRRTATQLGVEPAVRNERIHGVQHHDSFGWIRVKGTRLQTLASPTSTWTDIKTDYSISNYEDVQFLPFKATSTASGTTDTLRQGSAERYILTTNESMTPNAYVGKMLKIGSEIKLILSNTADVIYVQEKLEGSYNNGTSFEIVDQVDAMYIVSPGNNMLIWRGGSLLQELSFGFDKAAVQSYGAMNDTGRLFGMSYDDDNVYVSEVGTGEYFQKDSFIPTNLNGNLQNISEIQGKITLYSEYGRATIAGDNPDNFYIREAQGYKGCIAPGSIAQGVNVELYLSHEGIEYLQAVEQATITEGVSRSDSIKEKFEDHTNFYNAKSAISDGRYYLNIQGRTYIYDFERSVKFHKPIYTLASYDECSDVVVPGAVSKEWTAATEVQGQLVFAQGGIVYRVTDEKIGQNDPQKPLTYMMEFPIEHFNDYRNDKSVQKICTYFQHDVSADPEDVRTQFDVYVRFDEGDYELGYSAINVYDLETFLSERCNNMQYKIVVTDLETTVDEEIEFQESNTYFAPYNVKH